MAVARVGCRSGPGRRHPVSPVRSRPAGEEAPQPLPEAGLDLTGVERLLDLGGGSGAYAIAFARTLPGLEVTVFDLPTVTPLTRRYIEEEGLQGRIHTRDGDLRTDSYGSDYDLVFLSAICHMNGPAENLAMLGRVRQALSPGGRVVIQDFVLNDSKTAPTFAALFALNMLVGTREGSAYSGSEYLAWLEEAGFVEAHKVDLPGPTDLMVATRPGG